MVMLASLGYDGVVFIPEDEAGGMHGRYEEQIEWETKGLHRADVIVFWVPRSLEGKMPGLTTNDEFGYWKGRGGCLVWGNPPDAVKCRYQRDWCRRKGIPVCDSLLESLQTAVELVGDGVLRSGPEETLVPAHVFASPSYQQWRSRLGPENKVRDLVVEKTIRVAGNVFMWLIWAKVWIADEDRFKENEIVVGRLNLSATVVHGPLAGADTKIVLVKEFRTAGGHILDLPGGSSMHSMDALTIALEELDEEIDLKTTAADLVTHGSRTIYPSMLSHEAAVFSLSITAQKISEYEQMERDKVSFGKEEDTERTFICVRSVKELYELETSLVDWATLGMIARVVFC